MNGEFDDLPGAGKPVVIEQDPYVPASLRIAYRVIKNSGHVPLEITAFSEIRRLETKLRNDSASAEVRREWVNQISILKMELRRSIRF